MFACNRLFGSLGFLLDFIYLLDYRSQKTKTRSDTCREKEKNGINEDRGNKERETQMKRRKRKGERSRRKGKGRKGERGKERKEKVCGK